MTDDARSRARRPFLTAEWRHLVMLSYEVDLDVLAPLVPAGLALDLWHGRALVSVVGFRFLEDRKSTRLNSSHGYISYAVFCLKKKKTNDPNEDPLHYPRAECTANCRYSQSHH